MTKLLASASSSTLVLYTIGTMLGLGYLGSRITKLFKLPNVTGYILVGVACGPAALGIFPTDILSHMEFFTDIALSFIAFGVGQYFKISILKKNGKSIVIITLFEALVAALLVFLVMHLLFHFSLAFSCILAAIASSTAPASTIMTIRQTGAKGHFVETLLEIVALDDVVSLLAFSASLALGNGNNSWSSMVMPLVWNLFCITLGCFLGFVASVIFKRKKKRDNRLDLTLALIFLNGTICSLLGVSPLLSCMMFGMVFVNLSEEVSVFQQVSDFSAPFLMIFFIYSGTKLSITSLESLGLVGIVYFFTRIVGKYVGASVGALSVHEDPTIVKYLGLGLIPQAGVSIGLSALGARFLPPDMGQMLTTIIIASSVLYEMVGPACGKLALSLSGSFPSDGGQVVEAKKAPVVYKPTKGKPSVYINAEAFSEDQEEVHVGKRCPCQPNSVQFRFYHRAGKR